MCRLNNPFECNKYKITYNGTIVADKQISNKNSRIMRKKIKKRRPFIACTSGNSKNAQRNRVAGRDLFPRVRLNAETKGTLFPRQKLPFSEAPVESKAIPQLLGGGNSWGSRYGKKHSRPCGHAARDGVQDTTIDAYRTNGDGVNTICIHMKILSRRASCLFRIAIGFA